MAVIRPTRGRDRRLVVAGGLALASLAALAGCGGHSADASDATIPVAVSMTDCGPRWSAPAGGRLTFQVTNQYRAPMDVYLADATASTYYAEFEGIGAGASMTQSVVLGNGGYRFVCFPDDAASVSGPTVEITAAQHVGATTPGLTPVTQDDLIPVAQAYQKWVTGRLPALLTQVRRLQGAIDRHDLAAAERDWLVAHETYETLGAAYGAFGEADQAINAMPSTDVPALRDRHLEGFHKIEALLWQRSSTRAAAPYAAKLVGAVEHLRSTFAQTEVDPSQIALRAHEIVENTIQFELTGRTDAGSHTNLATMAANLRGATKTLSFVEPLLRSRYPDLGVTERALAGSLRLVQSFDRGRADAASDGWVPLQRLTRTQRGEIDASLQHTVELLSPVAAICDIRQVPGQ